MVQFSIEVGQAQVTAGVGICSSCLKSIYLRQPVLVRFITLARSIIAIWFRRLCCKVELLQQ